MKLPISVRNYGPWVDLNIDLEVELDHNHNGENIIIPIKINESFTLTERCKKRDANGHFLWGDSQGLDIKNDILDEFTEIFSFILSNRNRNWDGSELIDLLYSKMHPESRNEAIKNAINQYL
jgi:phage-related protein